MDADTLEAVMVDPAVARRVQPARSVYEAWVAAFNAAMVQAGVNTPARAAMWCAQLGHESAGLTYVRELWGPTATQKGYEGRADLGNTEPGDGYRYLGRGYLQITGRHNYTELSKWAYANGYVPTPTWFVDNPGQLELPRYGLLGVVWYWTVERPALNSYADAGDILAASVAVNGRNRNTGLPNGWDDRQARYARALTLGARLLPGSVEWVDVESTLPVLREGDGYPPAPAPTPVAGETPEPTAPAAPPPTTDTPPPSPASQPVVVPNPASPPNESVTPPGGFWVWLVAALTRIFRRS